MRRSLIRAAVVLLPAILTACGRGEPGAAASIPSWAKVAPEQIEAAGKAGVPVAFENSIGMRFVLIPAGTFTMGSPESEEEREARETLHDVTISNPYYMGVTEVTNRQFRLFRPRHDSKSYAGQALNGDDQPAVYLSLSDARDFAKWLTARDGARMYRLPTEAEWERACRAGTTAARYWGDGTADAIKYENVLTTSALDAMGRTPGVTYTVFLGEDGYVGSAPVARFLPNPWGLYDTLGNAQEWCSDKFTVPSSQPATDPEGKVGKDGVLRGGAWCITTGTVRAAYRFQYADRENFYYGVRLAADVPLK